MVDLELEHRVRQRTFEFLVEAQRMHGEVLPVAVLRRGIEVEGRRVPIFDLYRGIHKPSFLEAALSFVTAPSKHGQQAPYPDAMNADELLQYHYRAGGKSQYENRALHVAHEHRLPCVYFFGVVAGRYLPVCPVHIVADDDQGQRFLVDLTGMAATSAADLVAEAPERRYRSAIVRQRLHQARFREAVLRAYVSTCAFCRLRRPELVEAAHIVGDAQGGQPVVPNGVALCRLHHAAFDRHLMGVRPDLRIVVRNDVLDDTDGPMLLHGLQELHGRELAVPSRELNRPGVEYLEQRYAQFLTAS